MFPKVMVVGKSLGDVYTREFVQALANEGLCVRPLYVNMRSDLFTKLIWFLNELRKSDIVHFQFYISLFDVFVSPMVLMYYALARLMDKKTITTLHSIVLLPHNNSAHLVRSFYVNFYIRILVRLSNIVIVHTKAAQSLVETEYDVNKVFFFPIASYSSSANVLHSLKTVRKKLGISEEEKVIMLFGLPAPHKGFQFVIEALPEIVEKVGNVKVLIAGGTPASRDMNKEGGDKGDYVAQLRKLAIKNNVEDRVIFLGFIAEKEVPTLMSVADVVIFPYEKGTFAMSGALCQAISSLKPIICTDAPPFDFLEDRQTCIKIKNKDIKGAIVSSMVSLSTSEILNKELSRNLVSLRADLSIEIFAKKYIQLVTRLMILDLSAGEDSRSLSQKAFSTN